MAKARKIMWQGQWPILIKYPRKNLAEVFPPDHRLSKDETEVLCVYNTLDELRNHVHTLILCKQAEEFGGVVVTREYRDKDTDEL